jgi:SAM-dependent methyltransferase
MALFDKFAKNYDEGHTKAVRLSGFEPAYFHEYKCREISDYLRSKGLLDQKIELLNYGCGTGNSEKYIKKYLPDATVYSVDVSEESIKVARESNKDLTDVTFEPFDGQIIPFETEFDVIFIANVFHHIQHEKHVEILKTLHGKLRKGGFLFIFELNPLNPLTMRAVSTCPFDVNARCIRMSTMRGRMEEAGMKIVASRYTLFFPALLRALRPLEPVLGWLPVGGQYVVYAGR